jgi:hypothetical protein
VTKILSNIRQCFVQDREESDVPDERDEFEEGEGREIWFLNREVLVVRPREPFIEWAMASDEEGTVDPEWVETWVTSFLLPQSEGEEEALAGVRDSCGVIFELLLADWILDPNFWPEDRSWKNFQRWFSFERIEIAWDLVDAPLSSDPPLPDLDGPLADA